MDFETFMKSGMGKKMVLFILEEYYSDAFFPNDKFDTSLQNHQLQNGGKMDINLQKLELIHFTISGDTEIRDLVCSSFWHQH